MTDSTDNARVPERIAFRKAYMTHAITSGPLMDHPDYVEYVRADLAPDPLSDPRVKALVEAAKGGHDALVSAKAFILKKAGATNPAREDAIAAIRAALAAFEGGKTDD